MEYEVARSYGELQEWQKEEVCYLLLREEVAFEERYISCLYLLFMRAPTRGERRRVARLFAQVPLSELAKYGEWLLEGGALYDFPTLSSELTTPMIRLSDMSIRQFSMADSIYYKLKDARRGGAEREVLERQLVAVLYRWKGRGFDPLELPKIAEVTDKLREQQRVRIVFAYGCVRDYIVERYPEVFGRSTSRGGSSCKESPTVESPVLKKQSSYTPFSKVIATMAMDSTQVLGNWHECQGTRLYDFFDVLNEQLIRNKERK